jgi:alkylation response protein AidB-like acyl-CoA dehydrogenase
MCTLLRAARFLVEADGMANDDEIRAEVRAWLEEHWDEDRDLLEWRNMLADSGWGCPSWPVEWYGRGLRPGQNVVVSEEFARIGAVGVAGGAAMSLAAPTLLEHGSDDVKRRFLRPALTGEHRWCQLFSEPGNGSDLAGLTTRAVRDGDEWIVNGQKVWTTGALKAHYAMLVARTNIDVPKHKGITYFVIDMRQPGVEVRPLVQMNRYSSFNEVFLTDARVPVANMVGGEGDGWRVALATLAHERGLPSARPMAASTPGKGRCREAAAAEAADYNATYIWYPQRAGRADLAVPHLRGSDSAADPVARDRVAGLHALDHAAKWTARRAQAARLAGKPPGPEGSIGKLVGSEIARRSAAVHGQLAGAYGMLSGKDTPLDGLVGEILVSVPGQSIAGGTDEIQHNILGERSLGLPKDVSVDADIPFREVRTNPFRNSP